MHARRIPQQSILPVTLLLDSARFRGPGCGGDLPATSDPFSSHRRHFRGSGMAKRVYYLSIDGGV